MTTESRFDARIISCTPDEYHARPGFSSSVAKTLISRSPAHAKANIGCEPSSLLDRGSVIHRLVLGKGADYEIGNFPDWRTNAAKEFRDRVRAEGKVPVKAADFISWGSAAKRIREELGTLGIRLDGESELVIEWHEETPHGPLLCKAMLDHLWIAEGRILDLKITEDAAPFAIERTAENLGYGIQHAAYTRALTALRPDLAGRVDFLFAFCEPDDPWALNVAKPDGLFSEIGEKRWLRAVVEWAKCKHENRWPSYGDGINHLSAPPWALNKEIAL
jgi:hypothetical protein